MFLHNRLYPLLVVVLIATAGCGSSPPENDTRSRAFGDEDPLASTAVSSPRLRAPEVSIKCPGQSIPVSLPLRPVKGACLEAAEAYARTKECGLDEQMDRVREQCADACGKANCRQDHL